MSSEVLISVDGVSKKFCRSLKKSLWYGVQDMLREVGGAADRRSTLRSDEFWAVREAAFELRRGQCLGLIGQNGAGKSTLLRIINGLIKPDEGSVTIRGNIGALIALGAGFNPLLTGRENIYVNGTVLGLSTRRIREKLHEIVEFSGIGEFVDSPVQTYSSGMLVRLGFAVATSMEPDVLILDEVLAVGDSAFRAKCLKRIGAIASRSAIVFVSHDQSQISHICETALVLERGRPLFIGKTADALDVYKKSLPSTAGQTTTHLHEAIKEFKLTAKGHETLSRGCSGEPIEVTFEFDATRSIDVSIFHVNFYNDSGIPCAQLDLAHLVQVIPEGRSRLTARASRLDLARGDYSLNCAIFGDSGKETVVHSVGCGRFYVEGAPFLWIGYKVPVEATYWSTANATH